MAINIGKIFEIGEKRYYDSDSTILREERPIDSAGDFIFSTDGQTVEIQRRHELHYRYRAHRNVREYDAFPYFDSAGYVPAGTIALDLDSSRFYITHKEQWKALTLDDSDRFKRDFAFGGENYGFNSGGRTPLNVSSVERFPFASPFTTSIEVSDLSNNIIEAAATASKSHAYTMGGYVSSPVAGEIDTYEKYPFAAMTNSSLVGNLDIAKQSAAGHSSLYRNEGYITAGKLNPQTNTVKYFRFNNETELQSAPQNLRTGGIRDHTGFSGSEYLFIAGGYNTLTPPANFYGAGTLSVLRRYRLVTLTPDAGFRDISWGSVSPNRQRAAGAQSETYGYILGGFDGAVSLDIIDSFPFTSPGAATNVGSLTVAKRNSAGQSSKSAGYASGGFSPANNQIEQFPFASTPGTTATDLGDLAIARFSHVGHNY